MGDSTVFTEVPDTVGQRILFLHIPKTAGTALRNLFARHLGEGQVTKNLPTMALHEALVRHARLAAVCGHFVGEQGHGLPSGRTSITVLREPLDRFLSYFYFRKYDTQYSPVDQRVRVLDIDRFVAELTDRDMDDLNIQTSMLFPFGTDSLEVLPWPRKVEAALTALDRFDLVGTHAEIDDFVCMVSAHMGWHGEPRLERAQMTSRRIAADQLDAATRKRLEALLEPDRAVYEHAQKRFRQLRRRSILAARTSAAVRETGISRPASPAEGPTPRPQPGPPVPPVREFGDRRLEFTSVWAVGEMSGDSQALIGETLHIYMEFAAHETVDDLTAGFLIRDEQGLPVFGTNTWLLGEKYRVTPGVYCVRFSFVNRAERGEYTIDANLIRNGSHLEGCYHWKDRAARFDVHESAAMHFAGRVMMDATAALAPKTPEGSIAIIQAPVDSSAPPLSTGRLNPPLRDFSARIASLAELRATGPGTELLIHLEVENTGTDTWPALGKRQVCVSYHWHDTGGNVVERDGLRTALPRDVRPGERLRLVGLLRAPPRTGFLRLIWTLVQEEVGWFDEIDANSCCRLDVTVAQ